MMAFVDFILVDGNVFSMANLISFFSFCVAIGSITMIAQALMFAGGSMRR